MQVNIYEAKTKLSKLIELLDKEGEIIIAKRGAPIAKLIPYEPIEKRPWGVFSGQLEIPDDFDDYDEEIARAFGMID